MSAQHTPGPGHDQSLKVLIDEFAALEGRQPRVMVCRRRSSSDESKINSIAVNLAGYGFDVDIGIPFESSEKLGMNAIENDTDALVLLGLDINSDENFISELHALLSSKGYSDLLILYRDNDINVPNLDKRLENWLLEELR